MKSKTVIFLLLIITSLSFAQKQFFKGNTHTHCSLRSIEVFDISYTAERVVSDYKARGYDFLVFTDHENYWDASGLSSEDFTIISGSEIGIYLMDYGAHFTALGIQNQILGISVSHQQLINAIVGQGGIAFLNHPRWSTMPITAKQVINDMKENLYHVEIYNAGIDSPTDYDTSLWDSVLTTGRLMYGVACDDSHKESDQGRGWICVYASSLHPDTLIRAIRDGDFYASNGIVLESIVYASDRISVRSSNGTSIRFIGSEGVVLSTTTGAEATYMIQGDEGYVRAEISNPLNQTAWIQPYIIGESTDIEEEKWVGPADTNVLYPNYPNPFNPQTTINYQLLEPSPVILEIYNIAGVKVATLVDGQQSAGYHTIVWDGRDASGFSVAGGVYLCRIQAGAYQKTIRMLLMK